MKVLVVEDSADLRLLLEAWLGRECDLHTALDGEDALVQLETWEPQVMVTDLGMPRVNGLELIHRARADPRYRQLPVLLLTGMLTDPRIDEVKALPLTAVMEKPPTWSEVMPALRALVAEAQTQAQAIPLSSE
jgi:CheY-like chemotaxis protein